MDDGRSLCNIIDKNEKSFLQNTLNSIKKRIHLIKNKKKYKKNNKNNFNKGSLIKRKIKTKVSSEIKSNSLKKLKRVNNLKKQRHRYKNKIQTALNKKVYAIDELNQNSNTYIDNEEEIENLKKDTSNNYSDINEIISFHKNESNFLIKHEAFNTDDRILENSLFEKSNAPLDKYSFILNPYNDESPYEQEILEVEDYDINKIQAQPSSKLDNYKKIIEKQLEQIDKLKSLNVILIKRIQEFQNEIDALNDKISSINSVLERTFVSEWTKENISSDDRIQSLNLEITKLKEFNEYITNKYFLLEKESIRQNERSNFLEINKEVIVQYISSPDLSKTFVQINNFMIEEVNEAKLLTTKFVENSNNKQKVEYRYKCVSCSKEKECLFLECGHIPYCMSCLRELKNEVSKHKANISTQISKDDVINCPICHKKNKTFIKVII